MHFAFSLAKMGSYLRKKIYVYIFIFRERERELAQNPRDDR